jgi:hypothetical protein
MKKLARIGTAEAVKMTINRRKYESNTMGGCNHFHHWVAGGNGPI